MKMFKKMTAVLLAMALAVSMGAAMADDQPVSTMADSIVSLSGGSEGLDGIVITSLPENGDLVCLGRDLLCGEGVAAECLDELNYNGTEDSFTFMPVYTDGTVGDEIEYGVAAAVAVNTAPTVSDMSVATYKNMSTGGALDVDDSEGDRVECSVLTRPENGTVEMSGSRYVYTPYQNRTGTDTFTYMALDENGAWSGEATVTVNVKKYSGDACYSDMDGSSAQYAAARLYEEGVYVGRTIGGQMYFEPDETVTRAEFIAMVACACDYETAESASTLFADDDAIPAWSRQYVAAAVQNGVVLGDEGSGTVYLRAGDVITRAEAAVILDRAAEIDGEEASVRVYADSEFIPAWAEQSMSGADESGLLPAYADGTAAPEAELTRAEAAQAILRLMDYRDSQTVKTGLFGWLA